MLNSPSSGVLPLHGKEERTHQEDADRAKRNKRKGEGQIFIGGYEKLFKTGLSNSVICDSDRCTSFELN